MLLDRLHRCCHLLQLQLSQNSTIYASQKCLLSTSKIYTKNKKDLDSELDLSFSDHRKAFRSKTIGEVFRGYIVFRLCAITYLVDNNKRLMDLTKKIFGNTLFEKFMKATFYGHFVAGESDEEILKKIRGLEDYGVRSILDYSAEDDLVSVPTVEKEANKKVKIPEGHKMVEVSDPRELSRFTPENEFRDRSSNAKARTYYYQDEKQCDRNAVTFLKSILIIGSEQKKRKDTIKFAAIKMTALGRPELLMNLSEAIARAHQYMSLFSGRVGAKSILEHQLTQEDIERELDGVAKMNPEVNAWIDNIISDSSGVIHILPWNSVIRGKTDIQNAFQVPNLKTGKMESLAPPFSESEEAMFRRMMKRIHTIFVLAKKLDVKVMVDAEQSYFQLGISRITMELMRLYNTEKPVVFNTYQCYLKEAQYNLLLDLIQSDRQQFHFGAKLVRGAYMEQERERAKAMGYEDPINKDYQTTTQMYKTCMGDCIQRIKAGRDNGSTRSITIMAATHNEETIRFTIEMMREFGLDKKDQSICFGQLYGMCDQVSFPLAQAGYCVYKYVPYGPVSKVLPYLSRRLIENRGILDKTIKERKLLRKEFFRRFFRRS